MKNEGDGLRKLENRTVAKAGKQPYGSHSSNRLATYSGLSSDPPAAARRPSSEASPLALVAQGIRHQPRAHPALPGCRLPLPSRFLIF